MSRVAGIVCAVSLALYSASCFIVPTTLPKGAPQTESSAVVGQPSAINGTPESASWSRLLSVQPWVTNGNGAMPAFGEKLGPDDIEDVANYVYSKADKW
eukprot:s1072_g13.t1